MESYDKANMVPVFIHSFPDT